MNISIKIFIIWIIILIPSLADEVKVFEFTNEELNELDVRKVRGADNKTIYTIGSNDNGNFLKAIADNAASGLGKQVKIDLNKISKKWNKTKFFKAKRLEQYHRFQSFDSTEFSLEPDLKESPGCLRDFQTALF